MGRLPPETGVVITHLTRSAELIGERTEITGAAYRHLFRARRLAEGARLRLVDGHGNACWGEVVWVGRDRAEVALGEAAPANEPAYQLELWVAALRAERASWLVEKATEIGVTAIRFIATERTPRKYNTARLERLRRVAAAAVEQCHRSYLPEIEGVVPWDDLPALFAREGEVDYFVLDPESHPGAWSIDSGAGVVLVGPEGGWSPGERSQLAALGCTPVGLGPRVLRVETAALAAAARLLLG